jgi:hypothetical protein
MCYTGEGLVYVLHCFTKKTNATSPNDTKIEPQTVERVEAKTDKDEKALNPSQPAWGRHRKIRKMTRNVLEDLGIFTRGSGNVENQDRSAHRDREVRRPLYAK